MAILSDLNMRQHKEEFCVYGSLDGSRWQISGFASSPDRLRADVSPAKVKQWKKDGYTDLIVVKKVTTTTYSNHEPFATPAPREDTTGA